MAKCVLFDAVEHFVRYGDERLLLVGGLEGADDLDGLLAVLARQELRLLQPVALVHQLEGLLDVARLLEPPHDHWVQLGELQQESDMSGNTNHCCLMVCTEIKPNP